MNLIRFVWRTCRRMVVTTVVLAVLSGICNAALIAFVNAALVAENRRGALLMWAFVAVGLGKLITNFASQAMLIKFSQGVIARLRQDLVRKILAVPLRHLEEIGGPRVLVALTDDVFNITQALLAIPIIVVNVAILVCGAAYLGWISWQILLGVCVLIVLGGLGYRLIIVSAFHHLRNAREDGDRLYGHFRALTEALVVDAVIEPDPRAARLLENLLEGLTPERAALRRARTGRLAVAPRLRGGSLQ
jgi:putative ATP-binding cassette transporter